MDKEYGGYLPIELNCGQEYYFGDHVMAFNSARSAIAYIIQKNQFDKIYLPVYMCESVRNRLYKYDINVQYYHINGNMEPMQEAIEDSAIIMIPAYFGIKKHNKSLLDRFKHIIFDNTQAFFQEPFMREGIFNIYSCRKFIGVCDGAYLIGNDVNKRQITRYKPRFASYMLDSITYGTNTLYEVSLANEEQLEENEIYGMSRLSQRILEGIDYHKIIVKRKRNFVFMHQQLKDYNKLLILQDESCVPMVYPLLFESETLRDKLIDNSIYVPQWWRYILEDAESNEYEQYLSKYLLPLPIDQRYEINEIQQILDIVKKNM